MSGPKNGGDDAFDDFFGDPTSSGRMGPAPTEPSGAAFAEHPDDEPTQDVELRRREEATRAVRRGPVITPEPTPRGAVPEGWWEPDPTPPAQATTPPSATRSPTPAQHQQPAVQHEPPRRGLSPLAMVAVLVGGVLLGALCVGGAVVATSDDDTPVAQSTTVTETTSSQETTSPPSTSSTSTSTSSSSSSSSAKRPGKAPRGVTECAGPKAGVAVGRGSEVTSCAFASAVRDAYVAAKPKGGSASLEVRSPVTDKSYTMTCTGAAVTRCTGGNNAVVVLY
ncbi:hypothetical protein LP422_00155 [Janibacter limosus]|uniref:Uncharacterized protein n=1 Tax=Janibacter limosus TaxID=53458 RepID=A0AC61U4H3_9MICO|nr:hypothetical protein [Janibacter limosus]UUZ44873.1 hypothetical protein LP422_00155 [Janibacter limosus]